MPKRQNNWISPRNSSGNTSTSALKSSQLLHSQTVPDTSIMTLESQMSEEIRGVVLDLPNQNVVKADTDRARFISKDNHDAMQSMLTYFCKTEGVSYK